MTISINIDWLICFIAWLISLAVYEITKNKWALLMMWLFTGAQIGALL